MKRAEAKLCLDCDEVFAQANECPACGGGSWEWVGVWVKPLAGARQVPAPLMWSGLPATDRAEPS